MAAVEYVFVNGGVSMRGVSSQFSAGLILAFAIGCGRQAPTPAASGTNMPSHAGHREEVTGVPE